MDGRAVEGDGERNGASNLEWAKIFMQRFFGFFRCWRVIFHSTAKSKSSSSFSSSPSTSASSYRTRLYHIEHFNYRLDCRLSVVADPKMDPFVMNIDYLDETRL
jgi:hypothetical protein